MRNNYLRLFIAGLLVLALNMGARAQAQASSVAGGLSLAQARTAALASSRSLKKAGIAVEAALLVEKADAYSALPSLSASGSAKLGLGQAGSVSGSASLGVSETLWDGGKSAILGAIDALATKAARAEARAAYFAALEGADLAWYSVLAGEDAVASAQDDLAASAAGLALAQAKKEAGIITKAELLKAQAEEAAAQTSLGQASLSLRAARAKLSSLTGLSLPASLPDFDFASYEGLMRRLAGLDAPALETLVASITAAAVKNNPSLASASLAQDGARLEIDKARAGYLPSLEASLSNGLSLAESGTAYSGSLSLTATIPLDFWNTALAVKQKSLGADSARLDLEETRRSLDLELAQAVYTWASASRSVFSSRSALDYAESNHESVLESYRLSQASASSLSDAASLLSTNRKAWNAARYTFLESLAALKGLTGLEDEALLVGMVP